MQELGRTSQGARTIEPFHNPWSGLLLQGTRIPRVVCGSNNVKALTVVRQVESGPLEQCARWLLKKHLRDQSENINALVVIMIFERSIPVFKSRSQGAQLLKQTYKLNSSHSHLEAYRKHES